MLRDLRPCLGQDLRLCLRQDLRRELGRGGRLASDAEDVLVPLEAAQELLNVPGQVNTIEVLVASGSDVAAVRQAMLDNLGPGYTAERREAGNQLLASLETGDVVFTMLGVLALAMAGFIIFNTFRTIVVERRRDVGMLRAVGASRRTIVGLILTGSLLQGAISRLTNGETRSCLTDGGAATGDACSNDITTKAVLQRLLARLQF